MRYLIIIFFTIVCFNCNTHNKNNSLSSDLGSEKLNKSILSSDEIELLEQFHNRRDQVDNYIKQHSIERFSCPGCGFPTLTSRGNYEICAICNWEDDNQDNENADEVWGGPNYELSLTENRLIVQNHLLHLADSIKGQIVNSPSQMLILIDEQKKLFEDFIAKNENDLMTANHDDPVWDEYKRISESAIIKMIEKR